MSAKVIAIDGPAYVGKSQIAGALSGLTGYAFMNTGHMYRTVAKKARKGGLHAAEKDALLKCASALEFRFEAGKTYVNGEDWTLSLDDPEIVSFASKIAAIPELRAVLTDLQRQYAQKEWIIMEGRDIGSVVFPDARWKFFVTASLEVRAFRMRKMMPPAEQSQCPDFRVLIPKVLEIDEADRNRKVAPLVAAPDALIYDNAESPSAIQDARVLHYYLTHEDEVIRNAEILKHTALSTGVQSGKH